MSGSVGDILSSQNLDRLSAVLGIAGTGSALANSRASTQDRLALGGALIGSVGGLLSGLGGNQNRTPDYGFDVGRFRAQIETGMGGFADQSKFIMMIAPPTWARNNAMAAASASSEYQVNVGDNRTTTVTRPPNEITNIFTAIPFLCKSVVIPGIEITPASVRRYGYGSYEVRPGGVTYETLPAVFYVDNDYSILNFFTKWIQATINFDVQSLDRRTVQGAYYNEIQYSDNYTTTITIYAYDKAGNNIVAYKLYEAYPVAMNGIDMAWENRNAIATLNVAFRYKTWASNFVVPGMDNGDLRNLTIADYLIRGGNILQTISGFNTRVRNANDVINILGNISNVTRIFTGR